MATSKRDEFLGGCILAGLLFLWFSWPGSHSGANSHRSIKVGETATLRMKNGSEVPIAFTRDAYDRMMKLSRAKDL
ncbi:hypothetical protein [Planctomicrobium sp. SH664]|uniref:hypothetical protein n=1 Tax=Planctomicrobium sp. SH664 TaxID=3448125 RepID=UPI003F5C9EE4